MRISDWSSDVCSSDLRGFQRAEQLLGVGILVALLRLARHLDAGAPGEVVDRVEELEPVVVHQERDRRAVRAAAEAVVELFGRRHRERRRALVVERAARGVFLALALERHARVRSEEHTSELQSLMRISYAVFCLKKKKNK